MTLRAFGSGTLPVSGRTEQRITCKESSAAIDVQILELENSFESLPTTLSGTEDRESAADGLDTRTCPALTLPNELVSEIFVHSSPVIQNAHPQSVRCRRIYCATYGKNGGTLR